MARANRPGGHLALAFIEADSPKETNTRSGHVAGDDLLRQIYTGRRTKSETETPRLDSNQRPSD